MRCRPPRARPPPTSIAFDGFNGYLYVASYFGGNVSVVNAATNTVVVPSIPVQRDPWWLAFDSANGFVFVTNADSNNVTVIAVAYGHGAPSSSGAPSTFLGLAPDVGYALLAALIAWGVAATVATIVFSQRKQKPPTGAGPATGAPTPSPAPPSPPPPGAP